MFTCHPTLHSGKRELRVTSKLSGDWDNETVTAKLNQAPRVTATQKSSIARAPLLERGCSLSFTISRFYAQLINGRCRTIYKGQPSPPSILPPIATPVFPFPRTVNSFTIRHLRKRWYSKNFGHSPSRLGRKSRDSETKFLEMD